MGVYWRVSGKVFWHVVGRRSSQCVVGKCFGRSSLFVATTTLDCLSRLSFLEAHHFVLVVGFVSRRSRAFLTQCSIFWSIFEVFLIFSLFLELRRLWDHSQIVDLIFLNRMVSTRASESSKTPHSWQNNVPIPTQFSASFFITRVW